MTPSPSDSGFTASPGKTLRWCLAALLLLIPAVTGWTAGNTPTASRKAAEQQAPAQSETKPETAPIEITADRLISDTQNSQARFEGNVKAVQGDTTIEADRLQIHYKSDGAPQGSAGADALSKITASGNVRIKFDNRLAVTDEAVYITDQRILTLTGSPARVTSGEDRVSGTVIKFYRDSGRIEVQGGGGKQVEAIFHSGEKGIQ